MQTLYITIERERDSRPSSEGARFRGKVRAQPGGIALLMSTHNCQSVTRAKSEAETLFGELDWRAELQTADNPDVRAFAFLEIE